MLNPPKDMVEDTMVGQIVADKYRVIAPIAKGGMGRIYRAVQMPLEREVALKILDVAELRESTGKDDVGEDFQRRFFLEAASAARLSHPNTVIIHDYGRAGDDAYYIAMEYVDGQTLGELIEREAPLAPKRMEHIALQICGSIGEAHDSEFIHRDLKPSNVILAKRGDDSDFVKVLDFGLVKKRDDDVSLTQSGALVGTPRYMSPEQIACAPLGPTTDIYSLGALMYHGLTGRPPFDSESKFVLMAAHMNVEPPPMSDPAEGVVVPPELDEIVMRCLSKSPLERYQSMGELAQALRTGVPGTLDAMASGVGRKEARAVGALSSASSRRHSDSNIDTLNEAAPSPPTTRRRMALGLGLLLTLGGILALSGVFGGEAPLPPPQRVANGAPEPDTTAAAEPDVEEPDVEEPDVEEPPVVDEVPSPTPLPLVVETTPLRAQVLHQGVDLGDSPVTLLIPEGDQWVLEVSARGYASRQVEVTGGQESVRVRLRRRARPPREEAPPDRRTDNRNPWGN